MGARIRQHMTSKERITALIRGEPVDRIPICFDGICHGVLPLIADRFPDPFERVLYYLSEGIDTALSIEPPLSSSRGYSSRQWLDSDTEGPYPILHRTYETPAGTTEQIVYKTDDYPDQVKIFSDHNVPPSRSIRHLVMSSADLAPLEHILKPPEADELSDFRRSAGKAREFCDEHQVLLRGTLWGVGDPLFWLSGVERVLTSALDDPAFIDRFVEIVATLDQKRLELLIDAGVDIVVRRGWYECADFWSPDLFERFLFNPLQRQIRTAHDAGVLFVYVMNSGYAPYIDIFKTLGFDLLSNIDPVSGKLSSADLRNRVADAFALCGGVNNYAVIEQGSEDEVRIAVRQAVGDLGGGRFILAPGDSILSRSETAARNLRVMIDTWRSVCEIRG